MRSARLPKGAASRSGAMSLRMPGSLRMPSELEAPDLVEVHLVGAVGEPQGARARVRVRQAEVVADAGGAVLLDRPVEDLAAHDPRGPLYHGGFGCRRLVCQR